MPITTDHSDSPPAVLEQDQQTVSSAVPEQDQTIIGRIPQDNAQANPMSQAGFIASSSDNLFHPVPNVPSSYVFSLPNVPSNPRRHTSNIHNRTYHSPFSSYNNPTFAMPHAYYNHVPPPVTVPLGPPPIPPRIRSHSIRQFNQPQPQPPPFSHSQHMYNHTQPVHHQHMYNHTQPLHHSHQPAYIQP